MRDVNNLPYLSTMLCAFGLLLLLSGCNSDASDNGVNAHTFPNNVKAVVYIDSPREGSLLWLHGIAGKGELLVPVEGGLRCERLALRFAAGGFDGEGVDMQQAAPVRLLIYSTSVLQRLRSNEEVVSDHLVITDSSDTEFGDIHIASGLDKRYGFVLNPDDWSWPSLFGVRLSNTLC